MTSAGRLQFIKGSITVPSAAIVMLTEELKNNGSALFFFVRNGCDKRMILLTFVETKVRPSAALTTNCFIETFILKWQT